MRINIRWDKELFRQRWKSQDYGLIIKCLLVMTLITLLIIPGPIKTVLMLDEHTMIDCRIDDTHIPNNVPSRRSNTSSFHIIAEGNTYLVPKYILDCNYSEFDKKLRKHMDEGKFFSICYFERFNLGRNLKEVTSIQCDGQILLDYDHSITQYRNKSQQELELACSFLSIFVLSIPFLLGIIQITKKTKD